MLRRPRVIAGSTLGVAAAAAGAVLAFGGTAATAPAFAVTQTGSGVLVHLQYTTGQNLPQVEQKLTELGTNEKVLIQMARGAATSTGPVSCQPDPAGADIATPVSILVGDNGTEVVSAGQSAGNTAEGTFHLAGCWVENDSYAPSAGNSGIPSS
jgi:hypothetical protein